MTICMTVPLVLEETFREDPTLYKLMPAIYCKDLESTLYQL